MDAVWQMLKRQKLDPRALQDQGGGVYIATFPASQYDAVRRCQQRLYKATLDGNAVDFWITRYGLRVQQDAAYMWFEVKND